MTARRELTTAVLGAVVAGVLALVAGGQAWAESTIERRPPLPPVVETLSGSDAAPLVPAAGLVLLAAGLALLAVRAAGRVVVGLLVAVAGGVLAWSGGRALGDGLETAAGEAVEVSAGWPVLALLAGALGAAVGLLVVVRGRSWPGMGRRYERGPGPEAPRRPRSDEERAQDAWKALDRGEDPTA
ncbi:UNVERIFIED_ORG: TIGR02234 family membrane protein [Bacillus sp. AZ43]